MAVIFIAGTTAELIKIAPVMKELEKRGLSYQFWSTAQHVDSVQETIDELGVPAPSRYLLSTRNHAGVTRVSQVPGWLWKVFTGTFRQFRELKSEAQGGFVLVHGDTFTTVIGALIGKTMGATVGHIEAGLRSGSIRSPFPEELNRRLVGRLANVHFAPTEQEVENLSSLPTVRKGKAEIVLTGANTVVDALRNAKTDETDLPVLPERFGLVTLHRFELVRNINDFGSILTKLQEFSKQLPLVFVVGKSEGERLHALGLDEIFNDRMIRIDKRSYSKFLPILLKAQLVITDSGGLQEECAALGVPCAIYRERTERHQGIGENVVVTRLQIPILEDFLSNWEIYARPSRLNDFYPSRIIADRVCHEVGSGHASQ